MAKKKVAKSDTVVGKPLGLFDFVNAITADQRIEFFDNLSETEKKTYKNSRYMIHRFLSMNVDYIQIVNTIQKYTSIPDKAHYLFFTNMLPKKRQFNKYIKAENDDKYDSWLIELVAKHFQVSTKEAFEYLEIYYAHDKKGLRELCEKYGIDPKIIKKLKL